MKKLLYTAIAIVILSFLTAPAGAQKDEKADQNQNGKTKAATAAKAGGAATADKTTAIAPIKKEGKTMATDDWKARTAGGGGAGKGHAAVGGGGAAPHSSAADVNGDGKAAVGGGGAAPRAMGDASVLKPNIVSSPEYRSGKGVRVAAGDVNGDGKAAVGGGGAAPRAMGDASALKPNLMGSQEYRTAKKNKGKGKGSTAGTGSVEAGHAASDAVVKTTDKASPKLQKTAPKSGEIAPTKQ